MKFIFLSFLLIALNFAYGQNGDVQILKDTRINALIEKQSEVIPPAVNPQIDGYRIQLFFDSDKSKLNASRGSLICLV